MPQCWHQGRAWPCLYRFNCTTPDAAQCNPQPQPSARTPARPHSQQDLLPAISTRLAQWARADGSALAIPPADRRCEQSWGEIHMAGYDGCYAGQCMCFPSQVKEQSWAAANSLSARSWVVAAPGAGGSKQQPTKRHHTAPCADGCCAPAAAKRARPASRLRRGSGCCGSAGACAQATTSRGLLAGAALTKGVAGRIVAAIAATVLLAGRGSVRQCSARHFTGAGQPKMYNKTCNAEQSRRWGRCSTG